MKKNMMLMCDFYKICHKNLYPKNMTKLYSTWTPRSNEHFEGSEFVVWYGLQGFLKQLVSDFNEHFFARDLDEVINEYKLYIHNSFDENAETEHIIQLHSLGYLPLKIDSLNEGTKVPYRVPCVTVTNTHKNFAWLVNYLETLFSCSMWMPTTSATKAFMFKELINKYVDKTSDNKDWSRVGAGDFSYRGMSSNESAIVSASAFLTSFTKTSTIPAIQYLSEYYNSDVTKEDIGSWSASVEHSCTTSNFAVDGNEEYFFVRMLTELYPNRPFSFVADSYDYFAFLDKTLRNNKELVKNHKGCVRIRPDSGNPKTIVCGKKFFYESDDLTIENIVDWFTVRYQSNDIKQESLTFNTYYCKIDKKYYKVNISDLYSYKVTYEEYIPTLEDLGTLNILWGIFGGSINSKGYKVLHPSIGVVYGDAITLERCEDICETMLKMGFSVENIVFGVGSFSLQYATRDTQGWAYKATYGEIDDKPIMIFKDPKTDSGMKKSQKGMVHVYRDEDNQITYKDGYYNGMVSSDDFKLSDNNLLKTVFLDGKMIIEESLKGIRDRLHSDNGGF